MSQSQRCTSPGRQVSVANNFCTVAPNICGPSVWNVLHVTLLTPRILRWLLGFWKICASLAYIFFKLIFWEVLFSFCAPKLHVYYAGVQHKFGFSLKNSTRILSSKTAVLGELFGSLGLEICGKKMSTELCKTFRVCY
jgi:hypothetical protein